MDNSRSLNDTSGIVRMMIVKYATTCSVTYSSDDSRGVIYERKMFKLQATDFDFLPEDE
jgi:hypothetical protein